MKKIIVALIALAMVLSCVACGNNEEQKKPSDNTSTSQTSNEAESSSPTVDNGNTKLELEDVLKASEVSESDIFCNDDVDGSCILMQYTGKATIISLPTTYNGKQIAKTGKYIFGNGSPVEGINFSSSFLEISDYSCGTNTSLEIVVCGENIKTIGESAFQGCSSLHTVVLNDKLESIKPYAFAQCKSLKNIEIPQSVSEIDTTSFYGFADGFTITGVAGSYAETFANNAGITFISK